VSERRRNTDSDSRDTNNGDANNGDGGDGDGADACVVDECIDDDEEDACPGTSAVVDVAAAAAADS
jgi:hypothetical protein